MRLRTVSHLVQVVARLRAEGCLLALHPGYDHRADMGVIDFPVRQKVAHKVSEAHKKEKKRAKKDVTWKSSKSISPVEPGSKVELVQNHRPRPQLPSVLSGYARACY